MNALLSILFSLAVLLVTQTGEAAGLHLTAKLPASVLPLLPVEIEMVLENRGKETVAVHEFGIERLYRVEVVNAADRALVYRGFAAPLAGPLGERVSRPIALPVNASTSVQLVFANRWSEEKEPQGPAFPNPGRYLLTFTRTLTLETQGKREVTELHSSPTELEVGVVADADRAGYDKLRSMPYLPWILEPRVALQIGNEPELAAWERASRDYLNGHPSSPWTALVQFGLAARLYGKSARPGPAAHAASDEASQLMKVVLAKSSFAYGREALDLQRQFDKGKGGNASDPALQKVVTTEETKALESQFKLFLQYLSRGDVTNAQGLLDAGFRFNSRLNANEWLQKLAAEYEALGPDKLIISARTIAVKPETGGTVLISEVNYEAGIRKNRRRVDASFRQKNGKWLLASWDDRNPLPR